MNYVLPEIDENIEEKSMPFNDEFISFTLKKYLFEGKNQIEIDTEYYHSKVSETGSLSNQVLRTLSLISLNNTFNNIGLYNGENVNKVALFLANQEDENIKIIGKYLLKDNVINDSNNDRKYELYNKENFLEDVYIEEELYDSMVALLNKKRNIILKGAPGVGKTFMAKRLAYSIIGKKDKDKVKLIQFHQSYYYEDFIEGYRPNGNGFELTQGLFYHLCEEARGKKEKYFLIIDEINRGNLSKIFGELLMLIENDKRNEEISLTYSNKIFSVPDNIYLIGLMNTADRSLAIIDYALRRRFSFVPIEPAFENEKFLKTFKESFDDDYSNVLEVIKKINNAIKDDKSLGNGFEIGHSYFCHDIKNGIGTKKDIKDIINYEIVPLLEEYWYDDEDSLNKWKDALYGVIDD